MNKLPSVQNMPERTSFDRFPMTIGSWEGKRDYLSSEIMKQLWADDYVSATFRNRLVPNSIHILIPFYEYQGTRHTAHAPQSCLLGGGWTILTSADRLTSVGNDKDIVIRTMHMQKENTRMLASYFFFQRGRVITSPWLNKGYLMLDGFTKRRTDGALVRVEMTIVPGQTEEQAFLVLEDFIAGLWEILPKYVPL
jgi:EpsI family protein